VGVDEEGRMVVVDPTDGGAMRASVAANVPARIEAMEEEVVEAADGYGANQGGGVSH
jgi:hypothetical protein